MAKYYKLWEKEVSIVRIGSEAELESFLKILSEESRQEEDALLGKQKTTTRAIERDLKRYTKISEQEGEDSDDEEEEDDFDDEEAVAADEEEVEDDEGSSEEEGSEEESYEDEEGSAEGEESVSPDITYYKIRDEINDIRAAPSLKDKDVKQDMEQWLSRLNDNEKQVLLSYLNTVDKIMRSQVSGTDAQDPSEPPTSLTVSGVDDGSEAPEGELEQDQDEEEPLPDREDTSPPIKAGTSQDISEIKRRLTSLIS